MKHTLNPRILGIPRRRFMTMAVVFAVVCFIVIVMASLFWPDWLAAWLAPWLHIPLVVAFMLWFLTERSRHAKDSG